MSEFLILQRRGRTKTFTATLFSADCSTPITLVPGSDVVRVKIGKAGEEPALDLSSVPGESDQNGSSVTFTSGGIATFTIAQADTVDMEAGAYEIEIAAVIDAESVGPGAGVPPIKHVQNGTYYLQPQQFGEISEEQSSSSRGSSGSSSLNSSGSSSS